MSNVVVNRFFNKVRGFFYYYFSSKTHSYYPCKLVGEKKVKEPHNTVILYRIFDKPDLFEIAIDDLLRDPKALEKFHPAETVKFGAIALGDVLFKLEDENTRQQKYEDIKRKMLDTTRG